MAGQSERTLPVPHPGRRMLGLVGGTSLLTAVALLVLAPVLHRHDVGASPAYLLAGLLLGLPHGAVDHLVPAWMSARARPPAARLAVAFGYAALAGAALVVFRAVPGPALVGFLALSVAHFGTADEAFHAERDGRPVRQSVSGVLARGGPPVLVPLLLWPDAVDLLLTAVAPGVPELLTVEVRALAVACLLAAVARTVLRDVRAGRRADAAEPVLLLALFATVPPALAIGVYFATWHSARHVARLLHGDPGNHADLAAGRLGPPLRRFARRAALPTVAAVTALAALTVAPGRPIDLLPATVAVLAALTVPHSALVAWMDRRARPRHPSNPEN
ncbi:Brp/Blh family beta-carotene 15,15'-dioxygenase [Micromonospora coxensis]|uniref:Brp/Blh family beta-carotene 15,15'-dioxygenase n=1 Tax=Micromonospora coxensis TaxID=356852 RepID=UPI0012FE1166|nr:Brp/Blh family beta-carotene 15,15'-dioxygenase [Micromonospora coxensis]